jgi:RNA polymerase sigma factor (sigma-70 family)
MPSLDGWDLDYYRERLRQRADNLRIDRRVGVRFDESDLVQETLTRAWASNEPCRGESLRERLGWFFQIQDNVLRDEYDRQQAKKRDTRREVREQDRHAFGRALDESTAVWLAQVDGGGPTPSQAAVGREEQDRLRQEMSRLSDREREVMQMKLEGRTLQEIADHTGLTKNAVAGLIFRAQRRLAGALNPDEAPPDA